MSEQLNIFAQTAADAAPAASQPEEPPAAAASDPAAQMAQMERAAADCTKCGLARTRTQVVWGTGPVPARVVFIGEAPGRREDAGGEPFIGAAGKILDELLERAHIRRADIYITNIVKCRPPENRDPADSEIVACRDYLNAQLRLLRPRVIVTLGAFATRLILQTGAGISGLQGRVFETHGLQVLPLYHPAATIYDSNKRDPLFAAAPLLDRLANGDGAPCTTPTAGVAPAAPTAAATQPAPVGQEDS
ncbi:MAG: uracil-DNA glycosylase [Actinomycetes bacterium]|jgi:DNA polymerase|nr:uracil-DNA glycosylase [Actinomycetes bacterium]